MRPPAGATKSLEATEEAENVLLNALTARNQRILLREQKLVRKDVETALAGLKAEMVVRDRAARAQAVAKSDIAARNRTLRLIALRSQIPLLSGEARATRESEVAALEQAGKKSDQTLQFGLASDASRSWQQYINEREQLEADADRRMELRQAELAAEVQRRVREYRASALRAMNAPAVPVAPDLKVAPAPEVPAPASPQAIARKSLPSMAPTRSSHEVAGMRAHLIALIDQDLRRRVMRIAKERHWTPIYTAKPGAIDVTNVFREALRAEYARQ